MYNQVNKRWRIAIMGTFLQLCLGTVYAWSYFQKPLMSAYGWNNSQTAWVFSLAICFLGLSAAWGGQKLPVYGPRLLATAGGILFGAGYFIAALALHLKSLPLLYVGYGVVGGCGLGLGYVTPVATAAKWFPDKKGLVTGMVVMGFGLGALLMSKVFAPFLLALFDNNLVKVFGTLGLLFTGLCLVSAASLKNPPSVAGSVNALPEEDAPLSATLLSKRFLGMWFVFFCNITAGISLIGFQSPLIQDLLRQADSRLSSQELAAYGATLIAVSSLFNGLGRFFWGGVSDRIGRSKAFRLMLGTQIIIFICLLFVSKPMIFGLLVCYVLLCYGGGFGTMPSFVLDVFGSRKMAVVYGAMLTAWSTAGIIGPQMVAFLKDHYPARAAFYSFMAGGAWLLAGFIVALLLSDSALEAPKKRNS